MGVEDGTDDLQASSGVTFFPALKGDLAHP